MGHALMYIFFYQNLFVTAVIEREKYQENYFDPKLL